MTTKLEQSARRLKDLLVRPDDTIAEMYCYYMGNIDDALKDLREALDHSGDNTKMLKRPQNCGTGHCSCIECVIEPKAEDTGCIGCHAYPPPTKFCIDCEVFSPEARK